MLVLRSGYGVGDVLMATALLPEIRQRTRGLLVVESRLPELFRNNPDVNAVIGSDSRSRFLNQVARIRGIWRLGRRVVDWEDARALQLGYDFPPGDRHLIESMAVRAGLPAGRDERRPRLFLSREERNSAAWAAGAIVVQTTSTDNWTPNKHWIPGRMPNVGQRLAALGLAVIQVGAMTDEPVEAGRDLRGKTTLRDCAAILHSAAAFVGLEGGLMHLARAVGCRSVIVYTGYTRPDQTGYHENLNVRAEGAGEGCWRRDPCPDCRAAADAVTVEQVVSSVVQVLEKPAFYTDSGGRPPGDEARRRVN